MNQTTFSEIIILLFLRYLERWGLARMGEWTKGERRMNSSRPQHVQGETEKKRKSSKRQKENTQTLIHAHSPAPFSLSLRF
jgi:hypothetical protein